MKNLIGLPYIIFIFSCTASAQSVATLNLSRDSTVKISSQLGRESGTGFIVADNYVVTCFHVVARVNVSGNDATGSIFPDLKITLPSGEMVDGEVVSLPTEEDQAPLFYDFAFIKMRQRPTGAFAKVQLALVNETPILGDEVVFSGFPLATPGMVTHRGMVSGFNPAKDLIIIEASINKGNSGGALLDKEGHVIGIISLREGGITQALADLRKSILVNSQSMRVTIAGLDPSASTKALIDTLDQNISTGIGYARSIQFARAYMKKHPELIK